MLEIELKAGPQNDFKALKGTPVNYLLATRASFNIHSKGQIIGASDCLRVDQLKNQLLVIDSLEQKTTLIAFQ